MADADIAMPSASPPLPPPTAVTPQKRVLPARQRRESAAKRRASSPIAQPSPANKVAPVPVPESEPRQKRKYTKRASLVKPAAPVTRGSTGTPGAVGEVVPTKLIETKPLPSVRERQPDLLSTREYQSVADSAVLAASLHRSRIRWLSEGVFQRYWVKPVKRKGVVEQPPGNPDAKSMQKLGNATITIEPHTFDATFYTVKDMSAPPQYVPRPTPQPTVRPPHLSQPPHPPQTTAHPASRPPPSTGPAEVKLESPAPPPSTTTSSAPASAPGAAPAASATPAGPTKPNPDPVIQMLAQRAATDPHLKELMKDVASSRATPDQLKEFQGHIDDFNQIIKKQDAQRAEAAAARTAASASPSGYRALPTGGAGPGPMPHTHSHAHPYMYQPPPPPPPPRPEPIIKHIIIEFHSVVSSALGASTDRWMFPEHAVLEIRAGGMEMIASFLVERQGKDILQHSVTEGEQDGATQQKHQADEDYFTPVTMLIRATQHRTIETIARAARPLAECQQHMKAVMEKKTRAPREYLVHRLPRDKTLSDPTPADFVDSGVDVSDLEDDELRDHYGIS